MDKEQKIDAALKWLADHGVTGSKAYPWLYEALRKLGYPVRPPFFQPVAFTALLAGGIAGPMYGGLMYFLAPESREGLLYSVIFFGIFFGGLMALYTKKKVKQLNLPTWEEIGETHNSE